MKKSILKLKFSFLSLLLVCLSQVGLGTTYYVSTTGSNSNSGTTTTLAFLTLTKAISVATSGSDIISVAAGTYTDKNMTISNAVTINGAGASTTILNGSNGGRGISVTASGVTISGLTFENYYGGNSGASNSFGSYDGGAIYSSQAITITKCNFTTNTGGSASTGYASSGGAIAIEKTSLTSGNSTISQCIFSGNYIYDSGLSDDGQDAYGAAIVYYELNTSSYLTLNNCLFFNNDANGTALASDLSMGTANTSSIYIQSSAGSSYPCIINGCTIDEPSGGTYPITLKSGYLTVENSILWNTQTNATPINGASANITVEYSLGDNLSGVAGTTGNNVSETTLASIDFKNSSGAYTYYGDFILKPGSPAIAKAQSPTTGSYESNTVDINGTTRPNSPSIGAFEFGGCGSYTAGTYSIGPTGTFGNITACIDTLKQCGWTGNLILQLQSTYTSTAETFPIDFTGLSTSSSATLTFEPASGATGLTITSSNGTGTMKFDGQAYITFNGSPAAGNSMATTNLVISNTSTTGYAVGFVNDANNLTIEYCNIESDNTTTTAPASATAASPGTVAFFNPSAAAGNNNITIEYNTITTATSGAANYPTYQVYSTGNSTGTNQTITITNNNIADYASSTSGQNSYGIYLADYNTAWTIENNYLYEEATVTTAGTFTNAGIYVTYSASSANESFTINSNTIGFSSVSQAQVGSGTYTISSSGTPTFVGIYVNEVGTSTATIESNTIESIAVGSTTNSDNPNFYGIKTAGTASPTIESNTIGGSSNTIAVGNSGTITSGLATFYGVYTASTGAPTIETNTVSYITTYGTTATGGSTSYGIYNVPASGTSAATINSNTITNITHGSGYTTGVATFYGVASNSGGTSTIESNTVESVAVATSVTSGSATFYGVYTTGSGAPTVESNTIGASSYTVSVGGSSITGAGTTTFAGIKNSSTGTATIESNTIQNITNYGLTSAITSYGIYSSSGSASPTIESNTIQALTVGSSVTSAANTFYAIYTIGSGAPTIESNTIGSTSTANSIVMGVSGGTTTSSVWVFYGIYNACTSNSGPTISSNTIENVTTYGTTGTASNFYGVYNTSGASTGIQTVQSNTISTINLATNQTTGTPNCYGFYFANTSSDGSFNCSTNTISSVTVGNASGTGACTFYGVYYNSQPSNTATDPTIETNTITSITVNGSGSSFTGIYDIDAGSSNTHLIKFNAIGSTSSTNISVPAAVGGNVIGILVGTNSSTTYNIQNNTIQNMIAGTSSGSSTGNCGVFGIANSTIISGSNINGGATEVSTYNIILNTVNTIANLYSGAYTASSTTPYFVCGLYIIDAPKSLDVEQNRIISLTSDIPPGGNYTPNGVYGIMIWNNGYSTPTTAMSFYNNFINLSYVGGSTSNNSYVGIWFGAQSVSTSNEQYAVNLCYNTITLSGTAESGSASTTKYGNWYKIGATCLFMGAGTSHSSYIENNIFQNTIQSTSNQSQFVSQYYAGYMNNTTLAYNYGESYAAADYGYWASTNGGATLYTQTTWTASVSSTDVVKTEGTITVNSPSGSLSASNLSTVGIGADLHTTPGGTASSGCWIDINGYEGGTEADATHNRSTGAGHIGCWEDAGAFYWVGGNGNWSAYTNHWASSSGGTTYMGSAPSINDNAYFDGSSGGGVCTIDGTANCNNLYTSSGSNYTGSFAGSAAWNIGGSLTFNTSMTTQSTYTGTMTFVGTTTYSITPASTQVFSWPVVFNGSGGSWALQASGSFTGGLTFTAGSLIVGANTLTIGGTSVPTLTSGSYIDATNTSAAITFTNTSAFSLPSKLFNNSTTPTIPNVTLNGSGGVTINASDSWTITKNLTLTSGLLNIGSNILTLGASGTDVTSVSANTGTSASWIIASNTSGGVKQYVNNNSTTYQFPIGDATHSTPINFNFTSGTASGDYLTVYTTQATMPKFNTSGLTNYLNRYWSVAASGISSPNFAVNYYYNAADIHSSFTKLDPVEQINPTTPTYPQWVIPSGSVSNVTGSTTWTPTVYSASYKLGTASWTSASDYISWSGITQLPTAAHSLFGGADDQAADLPIDLVLFTAQPFGKDVLLNWQTASEQDNAYFTIEKTKDGVNFTTVTTVPGAGNSAELLSYAAVDSFPYQGLSYYRLKQTDYDGKFTYSNLAPVNFDASSSADDFLLYPNPVNNGLLNLSYIAKQGADLVVSFYDVQGRLVATQTIALSSNGAQLVNLYPAQGLKSGIYMVKGVSDSISFVKKVVVD